MTLLTVTQLRGHVESDLDDTALQRLLDSEDAEIVRLFGPVSSATELHAGGADVVQLVLDRQIASITSVTEVVDGTSTTLSADDYRQWWGQSLERLDDGTNPRSSWGERVTVVYVPNDATAQRTAVLIQLVQLALRYTGLRQESVGQGDYAATMLDQRRERARLLGQLAPRGGLWLA